MPDEQDTTNLFPSNEATPVTPVPPVTPLTQPELQTEVQPVVEPFAQPIVQPEAVAALQTPENPYFQNPAIATESLTPSAAEPTGQAPMTISSAPITPQPKKSRKGLIIASIIVGALLLLGGTSASAYFLWYQNPQKVVTDSLVNAITAKTVSINATVDYEATAGTKLKIEATGRNSLEGNVNLGVKLTINSEGTDYTVDGEGIYGVNGDIYFKVNDLQKLVDKFEEQSNGELDFSALNGVIKKIDSNWIKISSDDMGDVSKEYSKTQKCFADVSKSLENDKSFAKTARSEVEKLYKENSFIIIGKALDSRTIGGQDSIGYPITADRTKADAFFTGFEKTQLGKKMIECDDSLKFSDLADDYNKDNSSKPEIELWVSRFGHNITELNWKMSDADAKGTIVINPAFNKNEAVTVPTDSIKFSEITSDIEAAYSDLYSSSDTSSYSDVGTDVDFN
ncbi:MAG: hypothetical protein ACOH18_01640 [Candidatus Saccharimonadaceae bacterium]